MNLPNKLTLIDGTFPPEEAKEILMKMFSSKIGFHELKNFSTIVSSGKEDDIAAKRIPQLKESMSEINDFFEHADLSGKKIKIFGRIQIVIEE
jgi:hypothetical protein